MLRSLNDDALYLALCWLASRPRLTTVMIVAGCLAVGMLETPH